MLDSAINSSGDHSRTKHRPATNIMGYPLFKFAPIRWMFRPSAHMQLEHLGGSKAATRKPQIPDYLEDHYWWAYLRPASVKVFDHNPIVSAILWGCYGRLKRAAFVELKAGQKVLQAACVYGDFSPHLANLVGTDGRLDIIDIAALQVANCRRKLREFPHAQVRVADAAKPGSGVHNVVLCFFLLHELPDNYKRDVIDALLKRAGPDGKVVFIDYHRPHHLHPLRPIMSFVFDCLEPFAKTLWRREISSYAPAADKFTWRKETYFGGLYQKVLAERGVQSDNF